MSMKSLVYRNHAVKRMFERGIGNEDVRHVLATGEVIENYPDDTPYPSRLIMGWRNSRPLHIVVAENSVEQSIIVITVYEPDPKLWDDDYRRRRKS